MSERIHVQLKENSYDIDVAMNYIDGTAMFLLMHDYGDNTGRGKDKRVVIVSDENVWTLHGKIFTDSPKWKYYFGSWDENRDLVLLHPGEEYKQFHSLERIYHAFARSGLTRDGLVLAFGGGVVGDMAGFAAATWMRGVDFVQIPTTLLAMVDASVGGKTGLDIHEGKNLVGAFHQPARVFCDPAFLETLPERELRSGIAEIIKTAAISSEELFWDLAEADLRNLQTLELFIIACIRFKASVVEKDEKESDLRRILNFGHTFGHAIEAKYHYEKYTHGEAVAAGMRIAALFGEHVGITERGTAQRLTDVLTTSGLLIKEPVDDLLYYMRNDKKSASDGVSLVLLEKIGKPVLKYYSFAELQRILSELQLD